MERAAESFKEVLSFLSPTLLRYLILFFDDWKSRGKLLFINISWFIQCLKVLAMMLSKEVIKEKRGTINFGVDKDVDFILYL